MNSWLYRTLRFNYINVDVSAVRCFGATALTLLFDVM